MEIEIREVEVEDYKELLDFMKIIKEQQNYMKSLVLNQKVVQKMEFLMGKII